MARWPIYLDNALYLRRDLRRLPALVPLVVEMGQRMNAPPDLVASLAAVGQQHLLAFWDLIDEPARHTFAAQVAA